MAFLWGPGGPSMDLLFICVWSGNWVRFWEVSLAGMKVPQKHSFFQYLVMKDVNVLMVLHLWLNINWGCSWVCINSINWNWVWFWVFVKEEYKVNVFECSFFPESTWVRTLSPSSVWLSVILGTVAHWTSLSWDSPGKNTGAGCHCLLRLSWVAVVKKTEVT